MTFSPDPAAAPPPARSRRGTLLIAALAFAASAMVAATLSLIPVSLDPAPATPALPTAPALLPGDGPFLQASPFDPARRPPNGLGRLASAPVTAPPVDEDPGDVAGILVGAGVRKVLFTATEDWLAVGSRVQGWEIDAIETEQVRLRRGAAQRTLPVDAAVVQTPP